MPPRPKQFRPNLADYAAIAVGPLLIFLMIASLACFFVAVFFTGDFSARAYYVVTLYTMGAVALARIVIEYDRNYSIGYAFALGAAATFVLNRFVGSPISAIGIVVLIGYLADRIVHDCTLIDDTVDASGEGLIDRGLDEATGIAENAVHEHSNSIEDKEAPLSEKATRRKRSHQPGRTVFLLALAAMPLFALGQFSIGDSGETWTQAKLLLCIYLFSSLSLLVTTSFLNLRRYLRQRDVDMPPNVTVAWLTGGVGLVLALLILAFAAPLPGAYLANLELPKFLKADEMSASDWGWGGEGAENANGASSGTSRDTNPDNKEQTGAGRNRNRSSGRSGGIKEGSAGTDSGQQPGGQQSGGQQSGGQQSGGQQSGGQQSGGQQSGGQQSGGQQRSAIWRSAIWRSAIWRSAIWRSAVW